LKPFEGDLEDYQRYLLDHAKQQREQLQKSTKHNINLNSKHNTTLTPPSRDQRKVSTQKRQQITEQTRPLRKESDKLEKLIAKIEAEKQVLEKQLTQPDMASEAIVATSIKLKQLSDEIATTEERWLGIAEEIQQIEQDIDQSA
ncbi:MAG: hypothetical protein ACRCWR_03990, partial [Saezia sp.]